MGYKVSVIVPVYNAEKTLERAFDSVKNQTLGFENIELLLVDDCSTDGGFAMLQKWAAAYPNVRALRTEKNTGYAGAARNLALAHVSAPYVMFLDADDAYDKDACRALVAEMEKGGVELVSGYYSTVTWKNGRRVLLREIGNMAPATDGTLYEIPAEFESFTPQCNGFWSKIYKTEIIKENAIEFLTGCPGQDIIFLLEYTLCCRRVKYIKRRIVDYCQSAGSVTQNRSKAHFLRLTDHYLAMYDLFKSKNMLRFFGDHALCIDGYLREYSAAPGFSEQDTADVLKAWWPLIKYAWEIKLACPSAVVKTLLRDAAADDFESAVFHMEQFRALEGERVKLAAELADIYDSTAWKAARALQKLNFWSRSDGRNGL